MKRSKSAALDPVREVALDQLGEPPAEGAVEAETPTPEAPRKPRPVDAATAALFPPQATDLHELLAAAQKQWREATEREAPSLERLSAPGVVQRIETDAVSGYLAVVTADDTWRAFVAREQLATIVALLLRRPIEAIARELSRGPVSLAGATPSG